MGFFVLDIQAHIYLLPLILYHLPYRKKGNFGFRYNRLMPKTTTTVVKPPRSKSSDNPTVTVNWRASARLRHGHVWVYRSDILKQDELAPASLVTVNDEGGKFLGSALYSSSSQIALRFLGIERLKAVELLPELRQRIKAAVAYRRNLVEDANAYRVIFSEADGLPGLVVDRYNDVLTLQVLTQAMDRDDIREVLLQELVEQLAPEGVVESVDP